MLSFNDSTEQVAAPGDELIVLLMCSTARRSFASARLSEMPVEAQTVHGVFFLLGEINSEELDELPVDFVSSDIG